MRGGEARERDIDGGFFFFFFCFRYAKEVKVKIVWQPWKVVGDPAR